MARSVTLQSIADRARVSVSAASKALADDPQISEATKQRVRRVSRQLNYQPVRRHAPSTPRTIRVGLVLIDQPQDAFYWQEVFEPLAKIGPTLAIKLEVISLTSVDDQQVASQIAASAQSFDGLLLYGHIDEALFNTCAADKPCVLMGQTGGDPLWPTDQGHIVTVDAITMGQLATRQLIQAGHRRIAFICAHAPKGLWFDRWRCGYRYAHTDADLAIDGDLIQIGNPGPHVAFGAAEALRKLDAPPTAYVVPDAHTASIFREFMRHLEHPLEADQIICGATPGQAKSFELTDVPYLAIDSPAIAATSLQLLRRAADGQPAPPARICLPFAVHGISPPPPA